MCVESVCGRVRTPPILEFDILQRIADLDKKLIRPLFMGLLVGLSIEMLNLALTGETSVRACSSEKLSDQDF
jgi:hypothetical protein